MKQSCIATGLAADQHEAIAGPVTTAYTDFLLAAALDSDRVVGAQRRCQWSLCAGLRQLYNSGFQAGLRQAGLGQHVFAAAVPQEVVWQS